MISFTVDKLTPCLVDVQTGDIVETEVIRIRRKSFLSKFNEKTHWHVNWSKFPKEAEIYALVLKGTVSIQGLVAVQDNKDMDAVEIPWACAAPHNNVWEFGSKQYEGVGGHLFAIAIQRSEELGHGGCVVAEAMDRKILQYYTDKFNAVCVPLGNHPFRFVIDEQDAQKIKEVYTYDWSNDVL